MKKEFHALVTFPDIVIYMGPACVTAEVLKWVFFPRKTQLISPVRHHTESLKLEEISGCLLLQPRFPSREDYDV